MIHFLAGLYVPVDEVARRPGDFVMYQAGGIYVHSARLEALPGEPWRDGFIHRPGKVPQAKRQLRGPRPGADFAWEQPSTVTYHRRR